MWRKEKGGKKLKTATDPVYKLDILSAVIPQKKQCFLRELEVLQALTIGCLLHADDTVTFALLYLQEICELHRLHLEEDRAMLMIQT